MNAFLCGKIFGKLKNRFLSLFFSFLSFSLVLFFIVLDFFIFLDLFLVIEAIFWLNFTSILSSTGLWLRALAFALGFKFCFCFSFLWALGFGFLWVLGFSVRAGLNVFSPKKLNLRLQKVEVDRLRCFYALNNIYFLTGSFAASEFWKNFSLSVNQIH